MTALQHTQVYVRKRGVRVAGLWLLVSVAGLLAFSLMAGIEAAKEQLIERVAFGLIPGILYLVWIVFLNMVSAPIHLAQEDERKRNVLLSKLQEYEQSHSPLELTTSAALGLAEPTVVLAPVPDSRGNIVPQYSVRLVVRNAGYNPVHGVRVLLQAVSPWHELFHEQPLRFAHDQSPEADISRAGISLHPKEFAFVVLIRFKLDADGIVFCVASMELMRIAERINYTVYLVAQGDDVRPYHQRFALLLEGKQPELLPIG